MVEFLSILGLLFLAGYAMIQVVLPFMAGDPLPSKLSHLALLAFVMALLIYFLLTFIRHFYLHRVKYPVPITRENAQRHYETARTLISFLKLILILDMAALDLVLVVGLIIVFVIPISEILLLVTLGYFYGRLSQA